MTQAEVLAALALPSESRVDKRVPKKLLLEQGAPTPGDRRTIQTGIEELSWIAALKPTNIGVPAYRDEVREYLEVAILAGTFHAEAKASRLVELIHRAIPYPLLLISTQRDALVLSLAHKRFSQTQAKAIVLEGAITTATITHQTPFKDEFLGSIALSSQPSANLFSAYQGWMDQADTLAASHVSGSFVAAKTPAAIEARRAALALHDQHRSELSALRVRAVKEKQINRRVELNLEIRRLEGRLGKLAKEL